MHFRCQARVGIPRLELRTARDPPGLRIYTHIPVSSSQTTIDVMPDVYTSSVRLRLPHISLLVAFVFMQIFNRYLAVVSCSVAATMGPDDSTVNYKCPFVPPERILAQGITAEKLAHGLTNNEFEKLVVHAKEPKYPTALAIVRAAKYCNSEVAKSQGSHSVPEKVIKGSLTERGKIAWDTRWGTDLRDELQIVSERYPDRVNVVDPKKREALVSEAIYFGISNPVYLQLDPRSSPEQIADYIRSLENGGDDYMVNHLLVLKDKGYTDAEYLAPGNLEKLLRIFGPKTAAAMLIEGQLSALTKCCSAKGWIDAACAAIAEDPETVDALRDRVAANIVKNDDECLKSLSYNELRFVLADKRLEELGVTAESKKIDEKIAAAASFSEAVEYAMKNPSLVNACSGKTAEEITETIKAAKVEESKMVRYLLLMKTAKYSDIEHLRPENFEYIENLARGFIHARAAYIMAQACAAQTCMRFKSIKKTFVVPDDVPAILSSLEKKIKAPWDECMNGMPSYDMERILGEENFRNRVKKMTIDSLIYQCPLEIPGWAASSGLTAGDVRPGNEEEVLTKVIKLGIRKSWEVAKRLWDLRNVCTVALEAGKANTYMGLIKYYRFNKKASKLGPNRDRLKALASVFLRLRDELKESSPPGQVPVIDAPPRFT